MKKYLLLMIIAVFMMIPGQTAQDSSDHKHQTNEPEKEVKVTPKRVGDIYPLDTCPISGEKLGSLGAPLVSLYDGREVRFCYKGCVSKFESDQQKYFDKIDAYIIEQQKEKYPLDFCIIDTKEKISSTESENAYHVVENRLFIYCCSPCNKKVVADPQKYIQQLNEAAIQYQSPTYPIDVCIVSGDKIGAQAYNHIFNGSLVKFCRKDCGRMFDKNPQKYLGKMKI